MADGGLPDAGDPAEAVESVAGVEVNGGGVHHLFAAGLFSEIANGLDWADAEAAVEAAVEPLATGRKEVAGPAVEADAVDEVGGALRGFEVVLAAGVVGVTDAAVAVAVVDAVLAPDLSLADVNAFVVGEVALVLGVHKAGDEALRTVVSADDVGDHGEGFVDGLAVVFAGVVHGGEVAAGNEGDLVAVLVVKGGEEAARVFVLLAIVDQREPAEGPGHAAVGAAPGEGVATGLNADDAVVGDFVLADVAGGGDLDLVDPDDGDVGDVATGKRRGGGVREARSQREGGCGGGGAGEEDAAGPERATIWGPHGRAPSVSRSRGRRR